MKLALFGFICCETSYRDEGKYPSSGLRVPSSVILGEVDAEEIHLGHTRLAYLNKKVLWVSDVNRIFERCQLISHESGATNCLRTTSSEDEPQAQIPMLPIDISQFDRPQLKVTLDDQVVLYGTFGVALLQSCGKFSFLLGEPVKDIALVDRTLYFVTPFGQLRVFRKREGVSNSITYDGENLERIVKVEGGYDNILALTSDGKVFAYGSGTRGQIGFDCIVASTEEAYLLDCFSCVPIKDIACGGWHCFALSESHDLYGWGSNKDFQINKSSEATICPPVLIDVPGEGKQEFTEIRIVRAGSSHSAVYDSNDRVWAWGSNEFGQAPCFVVGDSSPGSSLDLPPRVRIKDIKCGRWSTAVLFDM